MRVRFMPGLAALAVCAIGAAHAAADAETAGRRPELITPEAEAAIRRGLQYLAKSQQGDGSWRGEHAWPAEDATSVRYPCTMTSMAGLALLAAGNTPHQGEYSRNVKRAVDFMLRCARENGAIIDPRCASRGMYEHGFALLFLSQVYGMEQEPDRQQRLGAILARATEFSGRCQLPSGGWPYEPGGSVDEGSVTVTQVQGLRAARDAGVPVARATMERAAAMLTALCNPDGGIRYNSEMKPGPGTGTTGISCAAMVTLHTAAYFDNPAAVRNREFVRKTVVGAPGAARGGIKDLSFRFYALLYAAQGFYFSGEEDWKGFFPSHRDWLVRTQGENGAWKDEIGEAFATSAALIALQLPYGYVPVFQR